MMKEYYTLDEIRSQPDAWSEAMKLVQRQQSALRSICDDTIQQVLFTGCGSTYYLSLAGAALFQELTGRTARAAPANELLFNPKLILTDQKTLLVAVSRSGSTTETVKAVEFFKREHRCPVLAITNYGEEPLAGLADLALVIPAGQERGVAQTRSFASLYLAAAAFAGAAAGQTELLEQMQSLPDTGRQLIPRYADLARRTGENLDVDRFYFLGSGSRYGLACEVNLKLKEMTLTHSEAFHFLEFRHGPMSMVTPTTMIVGLLSEGNRSHEQAVLDEMRRLGGQTLSLAESGADISFESGVAEPGRGVLYLPLLQLMAFYRALAKGLDPDKPTNLSSVIRLAL